MRMTLLAVLLCATCAWADGDNRLYVPISGETVGIALSGFCRMGGGMSPQQLTEVAWVKWP